MEETEKSYIAGFFDGEGCIYVGKIKTRNSYTLGGKVIIGCTNEQVINQLYKIIKNGTKNTYHHQRKNNWKSMFRIELAQKQGGDLLKEILPYLIVKKQQALLFIELGELKAKSRTSSKYNETRQNEILQEIRKLNQRGKS